MTLDRRGFLGAILALGAAPAIVRADSLMRIIAPETLVLEPAAIITPTLAEIINTTLRSRAPQLAATLARRNTLLQKMDQRASHYGWAA